LWILSRGDQAIDARHERAAARAVVIMTNAAMP